MALASCGGASEGAEEPAGQASHAGGEQAHHGHHGEHGRHGEHGHHGHQHASPEELRPLMRELYGWLGELQAALDAGDLEAAATKAQAIAVACDDAETQALDPDRFGPRFEEIDRELHGSAARLAEEAQAGALDPARALYPRVAGACVSCHAQAPTAGQVDLGDLAPVPEPAASE